MGDVATVFRFKLLPSFPPTFPFPHMSSSEKDLPLGLVKVSER